jgi:hypothetical protein
MVNVTVYDSCFALCVEFEVCLWNLNLNFIIILTMSCSSHGYVYFNYVLYDCVYLASLVDNTAQCNIILK